MYRFVDHDDIRVCCLVRKIRRSYDHLTYVAVTLYKPVCHGCKHAESRFMENQDPIPDVFSGTWERDYKDHGVSSSRIRFLKQLVESGEWRGPQCYWCGTFLALTGGDPFYVDKGSLSEYIKTKVLKGRKPRPWMKKIIFNVYRGKCAACKVQLTERTATYDHIVPWQGVRETSLDNLQPLCRDCNQRKANKFPNEVEHAPLVFPLLPYSENLFVR
ncbi:MAG: HNH endonuclease [Nitrospiraceae bacterium]|nr:HNH endonuclease [Nitrospiraceae bacterium]